MSTVSGSGSAGTMHGTGAVDGWRAHRSFASTASSVPGVRWWVRERLTRAGVDPEALDRAELLVSELATNAVQHARGPRLTVSVRTNGHIEAAVRDDDAAPPRPRRAEPWETDGRGLALVAALADAWGSRPASPGKWVWFRVERTSP